MPTENCDADRYAEADDFDGEMTPARTGPDPYLAFALRWWWLGLLGAIIGVGLAVAYMQFGPFPYQSVAQVQVPPQTTTNPNANSGQAVTATTNYTAEATTSQMFSLVSKELAGKLNLSASDLILLQQDGKIDIRATKGTNFITVVVTDADQGRARLLADTIATVFVRDVNGRASAQIDARQQLLEGQIDLTGRNYLTANLNQRQEELQTRLANQRTGLLQLQSSYQQENQRQAEADRLVATTGPPSPQIVATRNQWLETLNSQIAQVQNDIRDTNTQLDGVRAQLAKLPGSTDPSVSAAFASAYAEQLQSLTREYAQLQLDAPTARVPLIRYGVASDPLPASGRKKVVILGAGLGAVVAAGLAFGIDLLRRRRQQKLDAALAELAAESQPEAAPDMIPALIPAPMIGPTPVPTEPPTLVPTLPIVAARHNPVTEESVTPAPRKPDELVYLVERARQRREGKAAHTNGHGTNGLNGHHEAANGQAPRQRPLPTQDGEPPLRKAE